MGTNSLNKWKKQAKVNPEILVVGSLNIDLLIKVPRLPRLGESLPVDEFVITPEGKGANQAVACARLGAE
ncbi:ribokinase, partial [Candidatus Aerophobetes bacterium]|nr:ribokinase [Candidatus Aerophobetes bacterium]